MAFLTTSGSSADDCQIDGVRVQNVAYDGIRADGVQRTKIRFNQVTNFGHSGISSTSVGSTYEGPLIIGNTVLSSATGVSTGRNVQGTASSQLVNASCIFGEPRRDRIVHRHRYPGLQLSVRQGDGQHGTGPVQVFSVVGGSDNIVSENTALPLGNGAGIELGSNSSVCSVNTVLCSGTGVGITADNSTGTHISILGNKVTGAQAQGIRVASYDHVSIVGNIVTQSTSAVATYGVIEVSPTGSGLFVIGDNVIDGAGVSNYGICVKSLISEAVQLMIHDNAITGIASTTLVVPVAVHFAGAGTATDILLHDNSDGLWYRVVFRRFRSDAGGQRAVPRQRRRRDGGAGTRRPDAAGIGHSLREQHPVPGGRLRAGGTLSGTGPAQGIVKNGNDFVNANLKLTFPMPISLDPGESFTVYYTTVPSAWKDTKG